MHVITIERTRIMITLINRTSRPHMHSLDRIAEFVTCTFHHHARSHLCSHWRVLYAPSIACQLRSRYRVAFDHSSPTTDVIVSVPADFAESKYSTPKGSAPPSRSGSNTSNDSKRRDGPSRRKGSHIPAVDRASVSQSGCGG